MLVKNPKFEISAVSPKQYPQGDKPEVVLVGKSNVGKSSFINTMINRKNLARTSNTPGKTRQINFYNIDDIFYFVDLPGYGYSKMSKAEQVKCGKFIEDYLEKRDNISVVVMVVDIRHKPTADDVQMFDWIVSNGYRPVVVATKLDKIKRSQLSKSIKLIRDTLGAGKDVDIIPFSSVTKAGREDILNVFDELLLIP